MYKLRYLLGMKKYTTTKKAPQSVTKLTLSFKEHREESNISHLQKMFLSLTYLQAELNADGTRACFGHEALD